MKLFSIVYIYMKNANKINLNNSNLDYNTMNISSLDEGVTDTLNM